MGVAQLQGQRITKETLHFNLDCAAEHGANAKVRDDDGAKLRAFPPARRPAHPLVRLVRSQVLDEDGEKPSILAPLDAPPPLGLKYLLGSGITLYLKLMGGCALGFLLAGVVALPAIFDNANGGVLTSIGYDSIGTRFSLGNRLPFSVRFFPTQALDVLYSLVLMLTFYFLQTGAKAVAKEVDDGSVTPSDYTLYVTSVPEKLGSLRANRFDGSRVSR